MSPDTVKPKLNESMLKKIQDHRYWTALFFVVSVVGNRRIALYVQNSTNMTEKPDKSTTEKSRLSKSFIIVRTRKKPNTKAELAAQQAWSTSFPVTEFIFINLSSQVLARPKSSCRLCGDLGTSSKRAQGKSRNERDAKPGGKRA